MHNHKPPLRSDHYIPQVFLKGFRAHAKSGNFIWRFQRENSNKDLLRIKDAGCIVGYDIDLLDDTDPEYLARRLKVMEGRVGAALNEVRRGRAITDLPMSDQECVLKFLVDLYFRSPASQRVYLDEEAANLLKGIDGKVRALGFDTDNIFDPEWQAKHPNAYLFSDMWRFMNNPKEGLSPEAAAVLRARGGRKRFPKVDRIFQNKVWESLIAPVGGAEFITGDCPVVVHNQEDRVFWQLDGNGATITIPLSSKVALRGHSSATVLRSPFRYLDHVGVQRVNGLVAVCSWEIFSASESVEWKRFVGYVETETQFMTLKKLGPRQDPALGKNRPFI